MQNAEPLENLADQFARFPGIGRKGAVRMAYEVMSMSNEQAMELAKAIENAKVKLHRCRQRGVQHLRFPQTGPLRDLRGGIPAGCKSH